VSELADGHSIAARSAHRPVAAFPVSESLLSSSRFESAFSQQKESAMQRLTQNLKRFVRDEDGVTAIEYGLIAALIAVVIIATVQLVGTNLSKVFSFIGAELA
jgi:pilus assembly protein Flp/PilA